MGHELSRRARRFLQERKRKRMADLTHVLHAKAIDLGRLAIRATTAAGSGHPTTALSLAHLVSVLMYRVMRWTPTDPDNPGSDRLVLSEGHAVPIIYAACTDLGVTFEPDGKRRAMTERDLMTLREIGSAIDGHPNPVLGFPFFDAATGSLGQGLSVAAGLRCAARLDGLPKRIFCHHRRRRVARRTDLGSDGFLRRSPPRRGGRDLQLQHAGPERLCLVGAGLGASRGEGGGVRRADRNHRRPRSGGDRTRAPHRRRISGRSR